ncbi:hypothetical protein GCM10018962_91200 [Dactylosporangium matsuzakiense]|uniref:Uncharacterized protein n=1 Tax=Dactylosporangium matsuzakiense TaxID=53360 RepID=A0A9W6NRH7_9ACTN|nr:hypothetical protein GCM10017581_083490 [Dactylosporangium matsuzakiense]
MNAFSSTAAVTGQPEAAPLAAPPDAALLLGALGGLAASLTGTTAFVDAGGAEVIGSASSAQPANAVAASSRPGNATGSANRIFTRGIVGPPRAAVDVGFTTPLLPSGKEPLQHLHDQRMIVGLRQT